MKVSFWKLSQGTKEFSYAEILESIASGVVYVHKSTKAKGRSESAQGEDFVNAPIGDYFYLTHGNQGIYCIGQFTGPADIFSKHGHGWVERPFKFICAGVTRGAYDGEHKWWSPMDNSTFIKVPEAELKMFEDEILIPHFDLKLKKFGVKTKA
ncbi:hypothetical protein [Shewanella atlantica]|uniref:EVE domain-containing protein n=1 Tax=Shewanella atlantica TaxID=271099 RepID=A0A3S0IUD7_9GAMM|nr:hypothetical protein [Shewanella atlantica]RTR31658.1 hypothetical protein EKG39_13160 [Shewanella atlantica]